MYFNVWTHLTESQKSTETHRQYFRFAEQSLRHHRVDLWSRFRLRSHRLSMATFRSRHFHCRSSPSATTFGFYRPRLRPPETVVCPYFPTRL